MLWNGVKAEFLKSKGTALRKAHILVPILTALAFGLYCSYSPWSGYNKLDAYYQTLGAAMPFLAGLFCAQLADQEQAAGGFQSMLTLPRRIIAFFAKLILLLAFAFGALLLASVLFGLWFSVGLHNDFVKMGFYLVAALMVWATSIPLYLFSLYVAMVWGKGPAILLGLAGSLVGALFLTGMGSGIWVYTPCSWPSRCIAVLLAVWLESAPAGELLQAMGIWLIVLLVGLCLYAVWANTWEGPKSLGE